MLSALVLTAQLLVVSSWSLFGGSDKKTGTAVELDPPALDLLLKKPISAVLFYAPWCFYSQQVLPMWKITAEKLAMHDPPISVGQIDAYEHSEARVKHDVEAYPTIKLFVDDQVFMYPLNEPRNWATLVNWVNTHADRDHILESEADIDAFLEDNPAAVIGLFNTGRDAEQFKMSTRHFDDVSFAMAFGSRAKAIAAHLASIGKITREPSRFPSMVMVFDHDEGSGIYEGDMGDYHQVDQFVLARKVPMITEFTAGTADQIFSSGMPTLFLFRDVNTEVGKKAEEALRVASSTLRGNVVFALAGTVGAQHEQQLFQELGLDGSDPSAFPTTRLVFRPTRDHRHSRYMDAKARKYRIDGSHSERVFIEESNPDHYRSFVQQYLKGMISAYKRSEETPVYYGNEAVLQAVGNNFQQEVLDSPHDVLVNFYAPWCGHCRQLSGIYASVGEKLKHLKSTLKIVKVDATRNEIPVSITSFPTVLLYKAGNKGQPVHFRQQRTVDSFVGFLKQHCTHEVVERPARYDPYGNVVTNLEEL